MSTSPSAEQLGDRIAQQVTSQVSEYLTKHKLSSGSGSGRRGVANVVDHGAVGENEGADTTGFINAIEAADQNNGKVEIPGGNFYLDQTLDLPDGVSVRAPGEGKTTITPVHDNLSTFRPGNHTYLSGFMLDQNCHNRSRNMSVGIRLEGGVHNCDMANIEIKNISDGWEGKGIEYYCTEDDPHDTFANTMYNIDIRGDFQNGDNSGDFLFRARTNFGADRDADEFTNYIRDNWIDACTFRGQGKSAIEWVGPATRRNYTTRSIARDFTTCTGVFESSLGGKNNTFGFCGIFDCYSDGSAIGFYSDGWSGNPNRRSAFDLFHGCQVVNFENIANSGEIRGFRLRRSDYCKIDNCYAINVTMPNSDSYDGVGVRLSRSVEPEIHGLTTYGNDRNVRNDSNNTDPIWNHEVNGGPL